MNELLNDIEQLAQIKENIQDVYNAGYDQEWSDFWDTF
jgi:hypothetical protein